MIRQISRTAASLLLLLAAPQFALAAPSGGGTTTAIVLHANFDADPVGQAPNLTLPGAPAGDFLTLNQTAGSVVVESSVDGLTKPAHLKGNNGTGGVGLFAWAVPSVGAERVLVTWRSVAQDDNPVSLVACELTSTSGAFLASVEYTQHGVLTYNALGGASQTLPVGFSNNRSQLFTIVLDFLTHTSSLSVDGVPVTGFQAVPFAQSGSDFARLAFDEIGVHPQSFSVDDISASATFRIPDSSPSVSAPAAVSGEEGAALSVSVSASDPDGDPIASLTATGSAIDAGASFAADPGNASGTLSWTPGVGQAGTFSATFTASNALSGSATTAITIAHTDRPPTVSAPVGIDGEEGGILSFAVSASDPDGETIGSLIADTSNLPFGNDATLTPAGGNTSGIFLWHMQPGDAGTYAVTFIASNAISGSATTEITVAPAGVNATGVFTWTPQIGQEGTYHVTFTATDAGGTSTFTSTIEVVSGSFAAAPVARFASRSPGAVLAPQMPQKGPIISGTPTKQTLSGGTTILSVSASTDLSSGSASPAAALRAASISLADKAAQSIEITVDTSELPATNDADLEVDHEPNINGLTAVTVDAGATLTLFRGAVDPDLDPIVSFEADLTGLPSGSGATWTVNGTNSIGTLSWTPNLTEEGTFVVSFTARNRLVAHSQTAITVRAAAATRVFITGNQKIRLGSNRPFQCFYVEPIGGSFDLTDVDLATIRLVSPGTGAVSEIAPAPSKTLVIGDRDGNETSDIGICFSKTDLRQLFSLLHGKNMVTVAIQGQLVTGDFFRGEATVEVNAGGGSAVAASVSPNPLNPQAKLGFTIEKAGFARVRLFDLQGRLVRELLNEPNAAAGRREVTIDGHDLDGHPFASGIYFYRIETAAGVDVGRFAVVR